MYFREYSVNVRRTFDECLCEHLENIRECSQDAVLQTFARTFGEHNANVHTIFGEYYLASWVAAAENST